ncbi:MAG: prepilin-type N-terminal cleavage/methylation domain-containing protein [Candidatus Omnitrophica bacterium]|nr:prepilin-type N-terminal cleavage/methylation domain-containing protein [Candidatus Omnitrophota bacterium]
MKNSKGFTLVEIMIVVAIIALLASIAIPSLLRSNVMANDALARGKLRTFSTAAEMYSSVNEGNYATAIGDLTGATPPYLNQSMCGQTVSGFVYTCTLAVGGYTVTAVPSTLGVSGTTTFTITTGGILQ